MALGTNFDFEKIAEQLGAIPKVARFGAIAAILLGIGAAYYFLSHQEMQLQIQSMHAQAQQLQRQVNKVRVVAQNLDEFEQEVTDLQRELDLALRQLPNRKQFEDLLQDISTAGKKVGVQIRSIKRLKELEHDFYAEVPFKLQLEGDYHAIARFFQRVSKLPRIVNVGAMTIRIRTGVEEGRTMLSVDGMATTFRFLGEVVESASASNTGRPDRA